MQKMKILLTNFHTKNGGGHVTYLRNLTQLNKHEGITIGVASPQKSKLYKILKDSKYEYLYHCDFPAKLKELQNVIIAIKNFRNIISNFKPDIIHANGGADLSIVIWSTFFYHRFKIVRTHHAIKRIGKDFYHKLIYSNFVDMSIYVSRTSMLISQQNGLQPRKYRVIPNGIDLDLFRRKEKSKAIISELGLDKKDFIFGSCAGLGHYKRVDIFLQAASLIKNLDFKIVVLGQKDQEIGLRKIAKDLGINDRFIYGGFHNDVIPYLSTFDVGFIMSDKIETISFAAREMMAMGIPLLSSNFSGLSENVSHGLSGYLVDPHNVEKISEYMKAFIQMDKESLEQFSINSRTFSECNFSLSEQLNSHLEIYKSIMGFEVPKDRELKKGP